MRILVVEDEAAIAAALQDLLTGEGHAIDVASTGPEAIEFSGAYPYDLVVLDVVLAGMDGRAVARTLRSKGNHAPILMFTALDEVEQRVAGLDAGADDYLAKPFAAAELHARVRAAAPHTERVAGGLLPAEWAAGRRSRTRQAFPSWSRSRTIRRRGRHRA